MWNIIPGKKEEWIKPYLAEEGKIIWDVCKLIMVLIPNDYKLFLTLTQAVILIMTTKSELKKLYRSIVENYIISLITK